MAERTAAELFGKFFEYLAEGKPDAREKKMARRLYDESWNYDFNQYQMECDDALIKLGLAKKSRGQTLYLREDYE